MVPMILEVSYQMLHIVFHFNLSRINIFDGNEYLSIVSIVKEIVNRSWNSSTCLQKLWKEVGPDQSFVESFNYIWA